MRVFLIAAALCMTGQAAMSRPDAAQKSLPFAPVPVQSRAMRCGARAQVLAVLSDQMGQTRRAIGLAGTRAVMELFVADNGRWTITVTLPDGQTCLLANGDAFEGGNLALPALGRPA